MTKQEFLEGLRARLKGVPQEDLQKSLDYYEELLNDYVEDGKTEAEAVAALGDMEEIVSQILSEVPIGKLVGERFKPRRKLETWEIVLLVVGFPLWFSLLAAAVVLLLGVYVAIWSVAIALYAVNVALAVSGAACVLSTFLLLFTGRGATAIFMLGSGLCLAGISVFLFFGCKIVSKYILKGTKKSVLGIKRSMVKGGAQ